AGWTLSYIVESASGAFTNAGADRIGDIFASLLANELVTAGWHTLFMILTVGVVVLGVEQGLERAVRIIMPALIALLLVLLGYSMTSGSFGEGVRFLFEPRFDELTGASVVNAL